MEKSFKPLSGYLMLIILLALIGLAIYLGVTQQFMWMTITAIFTFVFVMPGFFYIDPNGSRVLTLFGKYKERSRTMAFSGQILSIPRNISPSGPKTLKASGSR